MFISALKNSMTTVQITRTPTDTIYSISNVRLAFVNNDVDKYRINLRLTSNTVASESTTDINHLQQYCSSDVNVLGLLVSARMIDVGDM